MSNQLRAGLRALGLDAAAIEQTILAEAPSPYTRPWIMKGEDEEDLLTRARSTRVGASSTGMPRETQRDGAKRLRDDHRAHLRNSGISDEMMDKAGLYSADGETVRAKLGWRPSRYSVSPAIAFPYPDASGKFSGYTRFRPDNPRNDKNGKPIKYESPLKTPNRLYFPPGIESLLQDANVPLLVVEGEKKALSAMQRGFPCIGLAGVFAFQKARKKTDGGKTYGKRELIDDFKAVVLQGRRLNLAFDSDRAEKSQVRQAEQRFAECAAELGAQVYVVELPSGPNGEKQGVDDFLVAHGEAGPAELQKLIDAAKPAEAPRKPTPFELAEMLIEDKYTEPDGCSLVWWRDEFYVSRKTHYHLYSDSEFKAMVTDWLAERHPDPRTSIVREIVASLQSLALLPFELDAPVYIGQSEKRNLISLSNGLLDVDALLAGNSKIILPHSPNWFSVNSLPFAYDSGANCPRFLEFLDEILEGDPERIATLKQWYGYNLLPDCSFQKFFLGEGEGANGKGVVADILEALLGADNVSHVQLENFGQRFALWGTIGKLANIISEVGDLAKTDEGVFKRFVAGEPIQMDRKGMPAVKSRPTARVTIFCNTRPRWLDRSEGIWRRQIFMPFRVTIPEDRWDKTLAQRIIETEITGVLNWALVGLYELRERGHFTESALSRQAAAEYRAETNPANAFLTEHCEECTEVDGRVRTTYLYLTYRKWATERGYMPLNDVHFGREVGRKFPRNKRRQDDGIWYRYGIRCPAAENETNHWKPYGEQRASYGRHSSVEDGKNGTG